MQVDTKALEVGDTVYGSFGQYGRINVKAGKVLKKTPSGQIRVSFEEKWPGNGKVRERRFSDRGWEIGGADRYSGFLINEETYRRMVAQQTSAEAMEAVTAHLRAWTFKTKADLDGFVDKLVQLAARVPDDWSPR